MVTVNNEEFPLFQLDTETSILTRLASRYGSIPKYLFFPDGKFPEKPSGDIQVVDLLKIIKKDAKRSTDFKKFWEKNEAKMKANNLDNEKDVLHVWLVYNKELERLAEYNPIILVEVAKTLNIDQEEFERFWKDKRPLLKKDLENRIKYVHLENEKYTELYNTFEQIADGLVYTEFNPQKVFLTVSLDLQDITLLEIFNYLILNDSVPFATCKNYYKILKDFIPSEEWGKNEITNTEEILLKVNEKINIETEKYKDYTDVKIAILDGVKCTLSPSSGVIGT